MKTSTLATKIMIGVLCLGVLAYLTIHFITGFREEIATTVAYDYSVAVGTEATAVLVREEAVLENSGTYVDLVKDEGEKVAANSVVALIYSDPAALNIRQEIRTLEAELEQLELALATGTQPVDSSKLDKQVIGSIVSLRSLTSGSDLSSLDDSVLNLRTMVFRRDYAYGDTDAAVQLSQLIGDKRTRLDVLNRSLSQNSQAVHAPAAGVFSGSVDGYETLITPDMLPTLTVSQFTALVEGDAPDKPDSVGKIITDSTWYLAALFDGSNELSLTQGRRYLISFSHDYYGTVEMTLEHISTEDGQTLAVFSSRTKLSETTLLRVQTVDIVVREITGIRVPRMALRVRTDTVTDENGNTTQVNAYGIYTIVGSRAEWQDVNVIYTGDTYYLVEPLNQSSSTRLRAGDTVILSSSGLYDGKVVR